MLSGINAQWSDAVLIEINETKTDSYRATSHKNLQKQNNKDLFLQLVYPGLYFTNNNFPAFISTEEVFDQPILLNPHTRLDFKHPTQEYFRQIYHYYGPLKISTTRSNLLYNISQETRFFCCQP